MKKFAKVALSAMLLAGAATALQGPTNARLVTAVGSPLNAAFVSFAVGTVALGVLAMALQARPDVGAMKALPWWAWMGGLYGCAFVVSAAWGVPGAGAGPSPLTLAFGWGSGTGAGRAPTRASRGSTTTVGSAASGWTSRVMVRSSPLASRRMSSTNERYRPSTRSFTMALGTASRKVPSTRSSGRMSWKVDDQTASETWACNEASHLVHRSAASATGWAIPPAGRSTARSTRCGKRATCRSDHGGSRGTVCRFRAADRTRRSRGGSGP